MLHSRRVALFVPWFVLAGVCGCAQDTVSPLPGTLLRVTAPTLSTDRIIGTLVQSTEGELVLDLADSGRKPIPRSAVTRLEWSRGRRGHVGKGVMWGALIGGAALAVGAGNQCDGGSYELDCVAGTFLGGAALGALGGAAVGALIRTEDWAEVAIANVRVTMAPVTRGVGLRLVLTW